MPTDSNGFKRAPNGMFAPGNKGGPGNPNYAKSRRFRQMLMDAVTDEDFLGVIETLVKEAKAGRPWAVQEFFLRTMGKADQTLFVEGGLSIEQVQQGIARLAHRLNVGEIDLS